MADPKEFAIVSEKAAYTVHNGETSPSVTVEPSLEAPRRGNSREIDGIRVIGMTDEECDFFNSFSPQMRKRLNRKIDLHLLPSLSLAWLVSHLDRGNIANAKIVGMDKDLHLTGDQYNVALAVFFISYIIFEVPSNIFLKKITRPSLYLGAMVVGFGIIVVIHGLVKDYAGLSAARFVLGICEAGLFPAGIYLCSLWYLPCDVGLRTGIFWSFSAVSGAFAGLLAAGIQQMDGVGGYAGWRWIFIIEGLVTILSGFVCIFLMVDLPSPKLKWLSSDEFRFLELSQLIKQGGRNIDGADSEGGLIGLRVWAEFKAVLSDWTVWAIGFLGLCGATGFYGLKFAMPTITASMGFSKTVAQLLTVPPYLVGGAVALVIAHMSDKMKKRALWVNITLILSALGHVVLLGLRGNYKHGRLGAGYAFIFVMSAGVHSTIPPAAAWITSNTAPAGRKAIGSAWLVTIANCGGFIGSFMYLDREAPAYGAGFGTGLGIGLAGLLTAIFVWFTYRRRNAKLAALPEEQIRSEYGDEKLLMMGNSSPLFKFQL